MKTFLASLHVSLSHMKLFMISSEGSPLKSRPLSFILPNIPLKFPTINMSFKEPWQVKSILAESLSIMFFLFIQIQYYDYIEIILNNDAIH